MPSDLVDDDGDLMLEARPDMVVFVVRDMFEVKDIFQFRRVGFSDVADSMVLEKNKKKALWVL